MRSIVALFGMSMVLQGCYVGPIFRVKQKKMTCGEPFLLWGGGLVAHVNSGKGNGKFGYIPPNPVLDWVEGDYDLKSGDFFWQNDYIPDSYRAVDNIDGFGAIWNDGDLDLIYDVEAVTDEDDTFDYRVREQRLGCEMERWVELTEFADPEDEDVPVPSEVWEGTFTEGVYEYTHRFGLHDRVMEATGVTEPDWSYVEELRYEEDGALIEWTEEGDGLGGVRREFNERVGSVLEGYWEREPNGDLTVEYQYDPNAAPEQAWDYIVDERGNGSGTLEIGPNRCDIELDEWSCVLEGCSSSALEGDSCDPPVRIPLVEYR